MKKSGLVIGIVLAFAAGAACSADLAAGKAKSASCAKCHGANGEGKGKIPAIAGKSESELSGAMHEFKSGKRANGMMKSATAKLSDGDIANLAAYYASLKGK